MRLYREGSAVISQGPDTFLNPKMSKLRDVSVLFLNALETGKENLLDSTAASGIRAIRYYKECGIRNVTLLDINSKTLAPMKANLRRNGVKAKALSISIQEFASSGNGPFDIVDLDPFGSPVPHIHDLLKVCHKDSTLLITATDTAVLCGAHAPACVKLYGAVPMHNVLCKEAGMRILIGFIARSAAQFNFGIHPALSISDMHYMRVFVTLKRGAVDALASMKSLGYATSCRSCQSFETFPGLVPELTRRCRNCGKEGDVAGPLWLGSLYDKALLSRIASSKGGGMEEARAELESLRAEADVPFFYSVPSVTSSLGIGSVSSARVAISLKARGYAVTPTQFCADAIKTDAPVREVIASVRSASRAEPL